MIRSVRLFVVFVSLAILCDAGKPCSPKAICIDIRECSSVAIFLKASEKPLPRRIVSFLLSQQCGFASGYPRVCCDDVPQVLPAPNQHFHQHNVQKYKKTEQLFDIRIKTAPPDASTVPYLKIKGGRGTNMHGVHVKSSPNFGGDYARNSVVATESSTSLNTDFEKFETKTSSSSDVDLMQFDVEFETSAPVPYINFNEGDLSKWFGVKIAAPLMSFKDISYNAGRFNFFTRRKRDVE